MRAFRSGGACASSSGQARGCAQLNRARGRGVVANVEWRLAAACKPSGEARAAKVVAHGLDEPRGLARKIGGEIAGLSRQLDVHDWRLQDRSRRMRNARARRVVLKRGALPERAQAFRSYQQQSPKSPSGQSLRQSPNARGQGAHTVRKNARLQTRSKMHADNPRLSTG
jgi:hypothetical protein